MEIDTDEDTSRTEEDNCGHSMEEIYRMNGEWSLPHFAEVRASTDHTVLFELPITDTTVPPTPHKGAQKWDANHVRLPCARQNEYVVKTDDNAEEIKERWSLIRAALTKDIRTSHDLEAAILSYNTKYSKTWRFTALHQMFYAIDESNAASFFAEILPGIIQLALALPDLIPGAIPLLKRGMNKSISFSQQQIASLLANAFLCTFPRRNAQGKRSEYRSFPDINFNRLFQANEPSAIEKLCCVCNYFRRVIRNMPTGVVTFTRRCLTDKLRIRWDKWEGDFKATKLHVTSGGTIEDQGRGLLQVDFANKYLGGGVLGHGCVQEEIRFVICPEMIVSKLITEVLDKNEALMMVGCERFSSYNGYASTFEFRSNFVDDTPYDKSRRRICNVVAIDALNFYAESDQYKEELIRRELDKAYVGYYHDMDSPAPGIATGNWGCGAFGGNKRLKALIQLMVCCVTCRPMVYFTFGDKDFKDELLGMHKFLVAERITVAELWSSLVQIRNHKIEPDQIYSFIYQWHTDIKHAHALVNDSPNFDCNDFQSTKPAPMPSSSLYQCRKSRPVIPPSTFYNKTDCDTTTSNGEKLSEKSHHNADVYRKSRSNLLDPADQAYYVEELAKIKAKQCATGASSLLSALDEDYGIREGGDDARCTETNDQPDCDVDMFADVEDEHCERTADAQNKIQAENDQSNEDIIPCTPPPPEKSLKRKAGSDKKQKKITDIYPRLNVNQ